MHSGEGLAERRRERAQADAAPFAVGRVEVVRHNDLGVQVQGGCLRQVNAVRSWILRELLHPSCALARKGDIGELVLKMSAARAMGFESAQSGHRKGNDDG